jgi:hypothetical protein
MNPKTKKIISWVLASLVAALFTFSAVGKFFTGPANESQIIAMGLNLTSIKVLGIIELISIILFMVPRTGIIGTMLLAAYMGGVIATHLEHGESIIAGCVIQAFIWIVAAVRFPELTQRLKGN